MSTISSHDAEELLKEDLDEEADAESFCSSKDPVPIITSPSEQNSSSSSSSSSSSEILENDALPLISNHTSAVEESDSYIVSFPENETSPSHPDDAIQIATVETRTVRVQEVVIPKDENEVLMHFKMQ